MSFFEAIEKLFPEPAQTTRQPESIILPADRDEETADQQSVTRAKKKTGQKPERFSFLGPCVVCSGRSFVYDDTGIFSCVACEPGKPGQPAEATGPGRSDSHHDPDLQVTENSRPHRITAKERENFTAAWPWIKEHMPELLAGGWTRPALLQRSRLSYPLGKWGVAWDSAWKKENLVIEIGRRGKIIFSFQTIRRTVTQTAHPPPRRKGDHGQGKAERCTV